MQYPKLVESKTAANEVALIEWNPGMDLLATVFHNGALTCSRLLGLQKVWHKQTCGKVISVAWRPDGRVLALGAYDEKTKENVCTLYDVEDGKEIHRITITNNITSITWFSCSSSSSQCQQEKEDPIKPKKIIPGGFCEPVKENFSHQLAHEQTQLNILMISDANLTVHLYALGLFYLGMIERPLGNLQIYKTHMSPCMQFITIISFGPEDGNSTLEVLRFDTFNKRSKEILNVARMYAKITAELEYLEDTLSAIKTSWTDVLAGLDNKLSSYCSRRFKNPAEPTRDDSMYTFISADDLLQLLVLGSTSDNLEKFLADMSDKGLRKLNSAIEQTCLRVQNLIVKNAQKCCYHLHKDLNMLRGMSLWRARYAEVGLDNGPIVQAMLEVGALMLKLTELQQVIDHSLKSTKSFFRWLISIACRVTGEQNNSVVPSDVNKTTQQDIQLITDFILENFDYNTNQYEPGSFMDLFGEKSELANVSYGNRPTCSNFTLEQVGQYFRREQLTRLKYSFTKPNTNFWIEFFEQRPELTRPKIDSENRSSTLLFYPHRAGTSLATEHSVASSSIANAFKTASSNFAGLLAKSTSIVNMRDFIRNAPTNKIRIEIDVQSMQHFTMFQTKPGLVTKQYLLSQSLVDRSFKLISLEFHTSQHNSTRQSRLSSHSSGNIVITDSCFYENKESRKMLLTFLLINQSSNDTLIVQIELAKLLDGANMADSRTSKDLTKVFRTNDTIDKYSCPQILRLDLLTDPACDRAHNPEMMVKKIKGVVAQDMFASSSRGVIAFTSCGNKRVHIYELESMALDPEIADDEVESEDKVDESLIDTDLMG